MKTMARSAATADVFSAIAELPRRRIIELLAPGARSVTEIAQVLHMAQPQASKHLKVLKEVGLVDVRVAGQQRLYSLNPRALEPVQEWARRVEAFWNQSFDQLDAYLEEMKKKENPL